MNTRPFARSALVFGLAGSVALACAGCASGAKRFERITPGMSSAEVKKTMEQGPTSFDAPGKDGYSSWYFGSEQCVLFKDGHVVSKDSAQEGAHASSYGVEYREIRQARCVAPGSAARASRDRQVSVPGVGSVRLPGEGG